MSEQITLEEALKLVSFTKDENGKWQVFNVKTSVYGDVRGTVWGTVRGEIYSGEWQRVETPRQSRFSLWKIRTLPFVK